MLGFKYVSSVYELWILRCNIAFTLMLLSIFGPFFLSLLFLSGDLYYAFSEYIAFFNKIISILLKIFKFIRDIAKNAKILLMFLVNFIISSKRIIIVCTIIYILCFSFIFSPVILWDSYNVSKHDPISIELTLKLIPYNDSFRIKIHYSRAELVIIHKMLLRVPNKNVLSNLVYPFDLIRIKILKNISSDVYILEVNNKRPQALSTKEKEYLQHLILSVNKPEGYLELNYSALMYFSKINIVYFKLLYSITKVNITDLLDIKVKSIEKNEDNSYIITVVLKNKVDNYLNIMLDIYESDKYKIISAEPEPLLLRTWTIYLVLRPKAEALIFIKYTLSK